ncbi:aminopeptidase P family N-terminal domain-containing protein [Mesorhizobium sp. M0243]|uniref:aminopeptidase P family N-terminal domain-containing protein n=1 Tax=Mesorhizobium sp. M0243 TaxID=2956925 RepID=UPI003335DE68
MTGNRQAFTTEEFKTRVAQVQSEMSVRGIDILLLHAPENIYYLTGHQTSGYFAYQTVVLAQTGDPQLLLRFLEKGNVDEYSWLPDASTWKRATISSKKRSPWCAVSVPPANASDWRKGPGF